jgi:hypothetical protein
MPGSVVSRCASPVSRLINRRTVFVPVLLTSGKLYINEKKKKEQKPGMRKKNIKTGCGGKPGGGGERIWRSPEDGDGEVVLFDGEGLRDRD